MINNCLEGPARILCENKESLHDVWTALRRNYGDPIALLKLKSAEISRLGQCKDGWSADRIRDWACSVQSKMEYLAVLSDKHDLLAELHHSTVIAEIIVQFIFKTNSSGPSLTLIWQVLRTCQS